MRLSRHTSETCMPGVSICVTGIPLAFRKAINLRLESMRPSSVPQAIQSSFRLAVIWIETGEVTFEIGAVDGR